MESRLHRIPNDWRIELGSVPNPQYTAGGPDALAQRASSVSDQGDHRLACQLVEWAAQAAPADAAVHAIRAEIYRRRRDDEVSLMARGIYGAAAAESEAIGETT